MKIVILINNHTLFFSKIGKDVENLSSAAVVIGALRVKDCLLFLWNLCWTTLMLQFVLWCDLVPSLANQTLLEI